VTAHRGGEIGELATRVFEKSFIGALAPRVNLGFNNAEKILGPAREVAPDFLLGLAYIDAIAKETVYARCQQQAFGNPFTPSIEAGIRGAERLHAKLEAAGGYFTGIIM
jgi:hypothetical protein